MIGDWNDIYTGHKWTLPFRRLGRRQSYADLAEEADHHLFDGAPRFTELQTEARRLIARIELQFAVDRDDETEADGSIDTELPGLLSTTLRPSTRSAPITFIFGAEEFPGVDLQYGYAGRSLFPGCFCDDCRETVHENAERLERVVAAVIEGRFTETRIRHRLGRDQYESHLAHQNSSEQQADRLDPDLRHVMPTGVTRWEPWPKRRIAT